MKKPLLAVSVTVCLFLIIWSCQKAKNTSTSINEKYPETQIKLVPEDVARSIAVSFLPNSYFDASNPLNHSPVHSKLSGNNQIKSSYIIPDTYGTPAIYVYNYDNAQGSLLVSADYQMNTIVAFIEQGEFKKGAIPGGLMIWLEKTIENFEVVRRGWYDNTAAAKVQWDAQITGTVNNATRTTGNTQTLRGQAIMGDPDHPVNCNTLPPPTSHTSGPLLPITWGQSCTYNDLCPAMSCPRPCTGNTSAFTGCVATSTAQIIRYWKAATTYDANYDYNSMPVALGNSEVQRLMKNIGTLAQLNYGCDGTDGDNQKIPVILTQFFGFSSATYSGYDVGSYATISSNVNTGWPALVGGCAEKNSFLFFYTPKNCHEWVIDGTQSFTSWYCTGGKPASSSGLMLHMNWGWHEQYGENDYNGWFQFDNWTVVRNDGTFDFKKYAADMIYSIHP